MNILGIRKCANCGKDVEIYHRKRLEADEVCCSTECINELKKKRNINCKCAICGKPLHRKPRQLKKAKQPITCSKECRIKLLKSGIYDGDNNPNYENKGESNPNFKGLTTSKNGYLFEYCPDHPFAIGGRVRQHRLIAERYLELTEYNSIEIDGKRYLRQDFDVHHINGVKTDNRICNLMILSREDHTFLHNKILKGNYPQRSFQFVKNNNNEVKILPSRNTAFSAGYDFVSPIDITIKPNEIAKISTGVKAIMLPDEFLMLTVRSSLGTKRNLRMATGTSIVDADYACNPDNDGDIIIPLYNYGKEDQVIQAGERIAQGVFIKYLSTDNDHSENERTGGFGSTGTK